MCELILGNDLTMLTVIITQIHRTREESIIGLGFKNVVRTESTKVGHSYL